MKSFRVITSSLPEVVVKVQGVPLHLAPAQNLINFPRLSHMVSLSAARRWRGGAAFVILDHTLALCTCVVVSGQTVIDFCLGLVLQSWWTQPACQPSGSCRFNIRRADRSSFTFQRAAAETRDIKSEQKGRTDLWGGPGATWAAGPCWPSSVQCQRVQ